MKSLLVILLAVAAAEAQEKQRCVPNTQFKQSCNTCFCDDDGFLMGCTLMLCDSNVWNLDGTKNDQPIIGGDKKIVKRSVWDKECEPGKFFKYYCNTCMCNKYGRVGRCTRMFCNEERYNEDSSLKINDRKDKKCEAGKAYSPDGCNTCICNKYGSGSICTSKRCSSNSIETHTEKEGKKWGPLYKQGDSCIPRESFYSECNQCVCLRNGRSAFCTSTEC